MSWREAVSAYVNQRITEAEWRDREFIDALVTIEDFILDGGPRSFAGALRWRQLHTTYPVNVLHLQKEFEELRTSTPEKLQDVLTEKARKRAEQQALADEAKRAAVAREEAARRAWLSAGGRP